MTRAPIEGQALPWHTHRWRQQILQGGSGTTASAAARVMQSRFSAMEVWLCSQLTCKQLSEACAEWQTAQSSTNLVCVRVHEGKEATRHQAGCTLHEGRPARPTFCRQQ